MSTGARFANNTLNKSIKPAAYNHHRSGAVPEAIAEPTPVEMQKAIGLVVVREDGTTLEVAKERFLIGRGRHCDLVIDSAKISREHAAIFRDGAGWSIEDLGSSNGTWHRRERIDRRRIQDGDEFFVCSEKIRCVLR